MRTLERFLVLGGLSISGVTYKPQPCWTCKKFAYGCSWSQSFIPIEGWKANTTIREAGSSRGVKHIIESYEIEYCPEYEYDGRCSICVYSKGEKVDKNFSKKCKHKKIYTDYCVNFKAR